MSLDAWELVASWTVPTDDPRSPVVTLMTAKGLGMDVQLMIMAVPGRVSTTK